MFELLSRVLLWLLIGTVVFSLFQKFYPTGNFVGRLVVVVFLIILLLSFVNPNEPAIASLWRVVSFPLKPLGAAILLMTFAAQRIKGGAIDKPGGYLVGWALSILLLASTPAVAYFLIQSPVARAAYPNVALLESKSATLVAFAGDTSVANMSGILGDTVIPQINADPNIIALNPSSINFPRYLLQRPQQIRRRGLRLEDFVPNAETLQLTTQVWDRYLGQVNSFLRPR
ncbi:hypothetical protein Riv7116_3143 [Rivularia sp. PCC 7116]|uniref:hypothetical protein n=1 Tax=Rivularia sp. PCC 7116 TaxID=373994 RepID=UPI00029F4D3B|nr:hypothetical protein [Rivularia sp. PCC 7116]AFY55616.1 hypothetical protein Riv7116_3143 [Rivularia sp. PCC 7116]